MRAVAVLPLHPTLFLAAAFTIAPTPAHAQDVLVCGWSTSNVGSYDIVTGTFASLWASSVGTGLSQAHSVRLGPNGNVFVSSFGTNEILEFQPDGTFVGVFATTSDVSILGPSDAVFGPDGNLYVSGLTSGGIGRYDGSTGAGIDQFVPPGQNNLNRTEMMEWGPDGNLYVCSASTNNVKVYAPDGTFQGNAFPPGTGGMSDPHDLAFRPGGTLLVASFATNVVVEYDVSGGFPGTLVGTFVSSGVGGPSSPHGLAWGPNGNLYVSSFSTGVVQEYSGVDGAPLAVFINTSPTVNGPTHLLFRPGAVSAPVASRAASGLMASPNPGRGRQTVTGAALGGTDRFVLILDAAGRRVARLPGSRRGASWDGRDAAGRAVPAGVYFARLEGDSDGRAVKLVRLR